MEKPQAKKDDWIKAQSKSRPGRFYLFNRSTGETQWLPVGKEGVGDASNTDGKESEAPPKILAARIPKTPAQDRLKRLQHDIKLDRLKKDTKKPTRRSQTDAKSKKFTDSSEQQENVLKEQPSSSSTSRSYSTSSIEKLSALPVKSPESPARCSKRSNLSVKDEVKRKIAKSPLKGNKSLDEFQTSHSITPLLPTTCKDIDDNISVVSNDSIGDYISVVSNDSIEDNISVASNDSICTAQTSQNTNTAASSSGILSRIKDIFKLPFSSFKTQTGQSANDKEKIPKTTASTTNASSSPVLTSLSELRAEQKKIEKQNILNKSLEATAASNNNNLPSSSVVLQALSELKTQQKLVENEREDRMGMGILAISNKSPSATSLVDVKEALNELRKQQNKLENKWEDMGKQLETSSSNSSLCSTPRNLSIPSYQRGSANARLDRLRHSLKLQQTSKTSAYTARTLSITVPTTPRATTSQLTTTPPNTIFLNTSTNSVYHSANNTINDDDIEAMDWQETEKEDIVEPCSTKTTTSALPPPQNKNEKLRNAAETMGDIYDRVSENLLRLAAEKNRDKNRITRKWLKDFYYFVVDTNVLLEYLVFLEDLSKMKLCDTQGSVLFIPYVVLQELDKLKMRSGSQEGVKTMAIRAIKYLNKKFENNNLNLQAETAIEERQHLIDVNSADDSIINCCLQAKAHLPNLVLLTEDVNLRNKAICNNILVTTKSDLMSKRYNKTNNKTDGL